MRQKVPARVLVLGFLIEHPYLVSWHSLRRVQVSRRRLVITVGWLAITRKIKISRKGAKLNASYLRTGKKLI